MTDSEKIKIVRQKMNKTQQQFAAMFGIQQGTYSDYERGRTPLPYSLVKELLTEHKLNIDWWENNKGTIFIEKTINGPKQKLVIECSDKYLKLLEEQNIDLKQKVKELEAKNKQGEFNQPTLLRAMEKLTERIESLNGLEHLLKEALEINTFKKK